MQRCGLRRCSQRDLIELSPPVGIHHCSNRAMILELTLLFGLFRWRGLIAKFAMTNFAARLCNIRAHSDHDGTYDDRRGAHESESVKKIDEVLGAILMLVEPGLPVSVGHRQNAIVGLLAEFVNRPGRDGADEDECQRCDLSAAAL